MATRQYIGARYVTKIYKNSQDPSSADWESGVTYEPLTMVTYLNNSYISRDMVPLTAGNPSIESDHWALTGFYNGQIASLQSQIDDINELITNLETRRIVFLADSYATFNGNDGNSYITQAAIENGLILNDTYYDFHISGCGFSADAPHQFLDLLQDNESSIIDKTLITDIIVLGGANDQLSTFGGIKTHISSFCAYVKSNYPNAKIQIGCISKSLESNTLIANIVNVVRAYKTCVQYGAGYINNSESAMTWLSRYKTDLLHPNADGVDMLGDLLSNYIKVGSLSVNRYLVMDNNIDFVSNADIMLRPGSSQPKMMQTQNNNMVSLAFSARGIMCYARMVNARTLQAGTTIFSNCIKFIDTLFYVRNDLLTQFYTEVWHGNNRFNAIISFDCNHVTNDGIVGSIVFENPGAAYTIDAGENISFIVPSEVVLSM